MTVLPAISLHQPWATLCATPAAPCDCAVGVDRELATRVPDYHQVHCAFRRAGWVKRYETRSRPCPPKHIGQRIAICSTVRPPIEGGWTGRYFTTRRPAVTLPDGTRLPRGRWLLGDFEGPDDALPVRLPFGAVVATAVITASLRIVEPAGCDETAHVCHGLADNLTHHRALTFAEINGPDTEHDISDQLPYGDWTPGRWAWELSDVEPVDMPSGSHKGRQGWHTAEVPS